jgi:hypothetical protein
VPPASKWKSETLMGWMEEDLTTASKWTLELWYFVTESVAKVE